MIPESMAAFSDGTLRVWLEDVSYADRAAVVVAKTTIAGVAHAPSQSTRGDSHATVIPFKLESPHDIEPAADYSVRVALEVPVRAGQDARILESDRSYPVLTRGHAAEVTVVLETPQPPDRGAR